MLSKEENDLLSIVYDSLLQLYVLRDHARRMKNAHQQAILDQVIAAVELRWHVLRQKRKGNFN